MVNRLLLIAVLLLSPVAAEAAKIKEVAANGVKAWVVEDNLLPVISIKIAFKNAGNAHDPDGKEGLGFEVASMLNEGAGEYDSQEYQKLLEENAIEFDPDLDKDNFYIEVKTLTENLDLALDLTNIAITRPGFEEDDFARIKSQTYTVLRKQQESESEIASREFEKAVFKNHPYSKSKQGEAKSIAAISTADLHEFAKRSFAKDNMVISIVGDVDDATVKRILSKLTTGLKEKSQTTELPEFTKFPKGSVVRVKMNNPQTFVLFGENGIQREDKDYYAAYILNHMLGGSGFSARLMTEVREKNGLAYTVGTSLQSFDRADLLIGMVSTKNKSVDKSIAIINQEFEKIAKNGVTPRELKDAKDYITGSFGLNLDKNENLASFLIVMQLYNLGLDYLDKRNDYFKSVTVEQVNEVAKRLISAENLTFIRVGL